MKNKLPSVSIIIAHFNGRRLIKNCLEALYRIDYPKDKFEVLVVDNGSCDGSLEYIKNKYKKAKVLVNDVNNYCKACNLGIAKSRGDYVVLLNNDVMVKKNWLKALVEVIKRDGSIGAVTSKLLNNGLIQNAGLFMLPNFYWSERGAGKKATEHNSMAEVDAVSGASVLYRKSALGQVGLLDEDFIMFTEDVDLSIRLKERGWKLVYAPDSVANHKKHGSCDEHFTRQAIEKNRLLLIAKHYPEKLSNALLGNEYFIVKTGEKESGSIFKLLPEILLKLNKEHPARVSEKIIREVCAELQKVVNLENKRLEEEVKSILNDLIETRKNRDHYKNEEDRYRKDIEERERDLYLKDNILCEKITQLASSQTEVKSLSGQLIEKDSQLVSYKDELANLVNQLKLRMDEVLTKDSQLIEKETEISSYKDELANLA
ncbi:MAG: glycosyltransferase, partial [Candidatus Omnitrophica bacterium]|nr:glycosyltransferase [Candidatus Omnitrophota bacterium]